jgi:hypothetical protein
VQLGGVRFAGHKCAGSDALHGNSKCISDAALGLDHARRARVAFELASQAKNLHVDLARAFHEIAPKQPVLLAAASSIDVSVDALAEGGISEGLRWPLASAELAAALARSLRKPGSLRP